MDANVEMLGGEVGEPVARHLVRHEEAVFQILDRQVAVVLGRPQERDGGGLGEQHGAGEVVGLDALPQELGEVPRLGVGEREVAERLEHHRA